MTTRTTAFSNELQGVFSHTKAEELLTQVVATLQRHEIVIESLESERAVHEKNRIDTKLQVSAVDQRLDSFLKQQEEIENGNTSIRKTMIKILNMLTNAVTIHDTRDMIATASKSLEEKINNLNQDLTKYDERIQILRSDMKKELEDGLFKSLSVEASSMQKYAEIIRAVSTLETSVRNDMEKESLRLDQEISSLATQSETEKLMKTIEGIRSSILSYNDVKEIVEVDELSKRVKNCEESSNTLFAAHETLAKHMTKRLDKLNEAICSNQNDSDTAVSLLSDEVALKAAKSDVEMMRGLIDTLSNDLKIISKKVDLAAQFIALYGEEDGESLE